MREDLDGAAHVLLHELKLATDILGELADVEVAVHEEYADHRRGEEV